MSAGSRRREGQEGFVRFTAREDIVNVWKLRGGKCVELRSYSTMDEALDALVGGEPTP